MPSLYTALRPLLFATDAETAHRGAIALGRIGQRIPGLLRAVHAPRLSAEDAALLRVDAFGQSFENPVGLAAGADKNAELVPLWRQIGLGFAEVGSVSARPAAGNPKPRAFRLPGDGALVNRMGLNNEGAARVAERIANLGSARRSPLAINVVKTHDPTIVGDAALDDFAEAASRMMPLADLLVLNVSCPNTAEGKTFEEPDALAPLLDRVMLERRRLGLGTPVLVKLSPPPSTDFDPGPVDALVDLALERGVGGLVATNTAPDRAGVTATPAAELERIGKGGLSGAPIRARATALVRHLHRRVDGRVPLIGVGGIDSADAAYERIRAGATLVEVYTGLVYGGPGLVGRILRGLAGRLREDGFAGIAEAVGVDA